LGKILKALWYFWKLWWIYFNWK